MTCGDENSCTNDYCLDGYGCVHQNNENSCDDGDPVTINDQCQNGSCTGQMPSCGNSDCNVCTIEDFDPNSYQCVESSPACKPGTSCAPTSCEDTCGGMSCDSSCTIEDGQCTCEPPKTCDPPSCDDGDACTADSCTSGGCWHDPIGASACDDGDACTADSCDPATGCTHTSVGCDDGDPCTVDACDPYSGGCTHTYSPASVCPSLGPCYGPASCSEDYGCQYAPLADGTSCNDGDSCTVNDVCVQGTCQGSASSSCEQVACEVWNEWMTSYGSVYTGGWYQTGRIVSVGTGDFWEGQNESGEPASSYSPTSGCESGLLVGSGYVQATPHHYADTGQPVMLAMAAPQNRPARPPPAARQPAAAATAPRVLAPITEMPRGTSMRLPQTYGFQIEPYGTQSAALRGTGFQSEHLLQDAAYGRDHGGRIPRRESPCMPVYGRAAQNVVDAAFPGHQPGNAVANTSAHFIKHRTFESGFRVNGQDACVGFWEYRTNGRRSAGSPVLAQDVGRVVQGSRLGTDTGGVYPPGHRPTHGEYLQTLRTAIRRMNGFSPAAENYVTQVNRRAVETILQYWPELRPNGPDGKPVPIWVEGGRLNPAIERLLNETYIPTLPENAVGGHPRE